MCVCACVHLSVSHTKGYTFAEEVKAGLILMGTHGKTGLGHFFGGSRTEDVANHSKIPVMTFKIPFD